MQAVSPRLLLAVFSTLWLLVGASGRASAQAVSQQAELTSSPGLARETFGWSVAIGGNTLVVGAPHQAQAAFVFTNSGEGWTQAAGLAGTNTGTGLSVAISSDGRTVATGNERHVLVFVEPATGWTDMTQTAELQPSGLAFGASVAVNADGSVIVVTGDNEGLVYQRPAGGWTGTVAAVASLVPPPGANRFGNSIAIDGGTVVVGDSELNSFVGAAYVYLLQRGLRKIPVTAMLTASDGGGLFGTSVAVNGGTVAVGSPSHNLGGGAVYVFVKPPSGWTDMTQTAELSLPPSGGTALGYSVAISGNIIISGAVGDTIGHNADQGAVFAYLKPPGGWVDTSMPNLSVTGSDSTTNDEFGYSVALSGKTAVIGAPFHAVNGNVDQGAAYVFGAK
jgi:hypothetical protein